jgi:hypothetical protein
MSNYRQGTNYYEILEVNRDAPQNEIHQAYQRAKATYSSDNPALYSMFSKEEARELMRMIEEAYAVLGNGNERRNYDQSLVGSEAAPVAQPIDQPTAQVPPPQVVHTPQASMPDFAATEAAAGTSDSYVVKKREAPKPNLPPGTGRTPMSTYSIKDDIEKEIASAEEWDGAFLKKIRTYKGVTIEQVSEASRISKTYLNAVEKDDFAALPAPVFVRGFIVQISRILGLNENKVATSYLKNLKAKSGK